MADRRYSLSKLRAAVRDPSAFVREGERLLSKAVFLLRHGPGMDVMAADWDNLLILDACRADYFAEHNLIEGDLRRVVSRGSSSREFIEANFAGRELHDTVLVTSNPFVEELSDDVFCDVHYAELFDQWDEELGTIPPGAVVDAAVRMNERYPHKRLVVHFMQPHAPYIGPTGRELHERHEFGVFNPEMMNRAAFDLPRTGVAQAVEEGLIGEEELRQAYAENVDIAVEHAAELVDRLDGKSVVTADHGELLGERLLVTKRYAHPGRYYVPELRLVPWLVVDAVDRRDVTTGEPSGFDRLEDTVRESHLDALGYA